MRFTSWAKLDPPAPFTAEMAVQYGMAQASAGSALSSVSRSKVSPTRMSFASSQYTSPWFTRLSASFA